MSTDTARQSSFAASRDDAIANFGVDVVGAMDEIAELVFAQRRLVEGMNGAWSGKHTHALATRIEHALHHVK